MASLMSGFDRTVLKPKSSVTVNGPTTIGIELAIPWAVLDVTPATGSLVRFDLLYTDVDRANGKLVRGTLRWAGGASKSGYMWLR